MYRLVVLVGRRLECVAEDRTIERLAGYAARHHPQQPARVLDPQGNVILRMIWPEVST